jgi:hypothetical protein
MTIRDILVDHLPVQPIPSRPIECTRLIHAYEHSMLSVPQRVPGRLHDSGHLFRSRARCAVRGLFRAQAVGPLQNPHEAFVDEAFHEFTDMWSERNWPPAFQLFGRFVLFEHWAKLRLSPRTWYFPAPP